MAARKKSVVSESEVAAATETIVTGPESTTKSEVSMDNNFNLENDGVTEIEMHPAVSTGRVGDPKSMGVRNLDILGATIEVESFDTGAVRFGKTEGIKEYVTLRHFNEVLGFLNGIKYTLDGKYPQLSRGWHAKFDAGDFDYSNLTDAAYLNWDILGDPNVAKMLVAHGIERKQGGMLVLGIKNYKLYPQYHVNPVKDAELVVTAKVAKLEREAAKVKDQATLDLVAQYRDGVIDISLLDLPEMSNEELQPWRDRNDKAWNQVNLHKGLDLILDVVAGKRAVLVAFKPFAGLREESKSFQISVINSKKALVFGTREERAADTARGIQASVDRKFIAKGAYLVREDIGGIGTAATQLVSGGMRVFVAGVEREVQPEQLIKASLRYAEAGEFTRHMPKPLNLDAVKAAAQFAKSKGWDIHVVSAL